MPAKNIDHLRSALFDTLDALRDTEKPMDIERAKAVVDVAQALINTAKVEVDFARVTGRASDSGFLKIEHRGPPPASLVDESESGRDFDGNPVSPGIVSVRRHRLAG